MPRSGRFRLAGAGALALLGLTGCDNRIPTATGTDLFPNGATPYSVDVTVPASGFLLSNTVYEGYTTLADAPYLLVAQGYEGALTAHGLARFSSFPDSVVYVYRGTTTTDRSYGFGGSSVYALIDTLSSAVRTPVTLRLWAVTQPWDSTSATWQYADARPGSRVPWRTPGGTLGALLAETTWMPGDTVRRDSVVWRVDSTSVARLASGAFAGIAVTSTTAGSRVQLSTPVLRPSVRPATHADTAFVVGSLPAHARTSVFTPDPPAGQGFLRVGGPTGQRSVLRLQLPASVPGCPPGGACSPEALSRVTLNRATLDLQPVAVPNGFGALGSTVVQVRRVLEPELGRNSPLGEVLAQDSVPSAALGAGSPVVSLDLTATVRNALAAGKTTLNVALLALPTSRFGAVWFSAAPGLRLVYTLPLNLPLP